MVESLPDDCTLNHICPFQLKGSNIFFLGGMQSKTQSKEVHGMYCNVKQVKFRSSKARHNLFRVFVTKALLELITYGTEEKDLQHLSARST